MRRANNTSETAGSGEVCQAEDLVRHRSRLANGIDSSAATTTDEDTATATTANGGSTASGNSSSDVSSSRQSSSRYSDSHPLIANAESGGGGNATVLVNPFADVQLLGSADATPAAANSPARFSSLRSSNRPSAQQQLRAQLASHFGIDLEALELLVEVGPERIGGV